MDNDCVVRGIQIADSKQSLEEQENDLRANWATGCIKKRKLEPKPELKPFVSLVGSPWANHPSPIEIWEKKEKGERNVMPQKKQRWSGNKKNGHKGKQPEQSGNSKGEYEKRKYPPKKASSGAGNTPQRERRDAISLQENVQPPNLKGAPPRKRKSFEKAFGW